MTDIPDRDLMTMIVAADDEAFQEDVDPKGREIVVIRKVMAKLGNQGFVLAGDGTPPIVEKISVMHRSLYRPTDVAMGGIHGGIFMFRDVFARIHIPLVFGTVSFDPFKHTDLSPMQLKWLGSRPGDMRAFLDQFTDIMDFAGGIGNLADYKTPPQGALEVFWLAGFQLQAAAATLSAAFDFRGAVQSALIGTELALKGGLAAIGMDEKAWKRHGHDFTAAADSYATAMPGFDIDRARAVLKRMPAYVENRYSPTQPKRVETGHIVMGAQYVAGEVMRQVTGYTIRSAYSEAVERVYP